MNKRDQEMQEAMANGQTIPGAQLPPELQQQLGQYAFAPEVQQQLAAQFSPEDQQALFQQQAQ